MQTRDMKVLEGIEKHKYLRTDQAAELYFQAIKDPVQRVSKARTRLLMLHRQKLLKRARFPGEHFIYFTHGNTRSHKMNHYITITDIFLQLKKNFPASSNIDYDIEVKHGDIITDLVIDYKNEFREEHARYYVEVELDSSGDVEAKIRAYEEVLDQQDKLVVVCKHHRTAAKIQANKYIIPVMVCTLDTIQELKLTESIDSNKVVGEGAKRRKFR